ncbi:biopolymer transport protein ExbD [Sagittula marina]|uniref:Biopolymer transport protein ExbD n=1 Tax=Sagittula marina TaxID=943940 RepID=A0A7W6DSQ6_9RHOB|nr:biopolymer transporter ExbD [Sagittula marina]MBB3985393.1 biopolymer transport protein ExbD [Sagittula marina]
MQRRRRTSDREPTTALINIVFLMLIFFLVAGTLAQPLGKDLTLVRTADLDRQNPANALVVHADGRMTYRGAEVASAEAYVAGLTEEERVRVRIVPDRDLPAKELVQLGRALRTAGAESVVLVTERGLE